MVYDTSSACSTYDPHAGPQSTLFQKVTKNLQDNTCVGCSSYNWQWFQDPLIQLSMLSYKLCLERSKSHIGHLVVAIIPTTSPCYTWSLDRVHNLSNGHDAGAQ